MQENKIWTFVYTEIKSNQLIAIKRSTGLDFTIETPEIHTVLIIENRKEKFELQNKYIFTSSTGLREIAEKNAIPETEFIILKKKIEIINSLRTNIEMARKEITLRFSDDNVTKNKKLHDEFFKYFQFMKSEEKILINRLDDFLNAMVKNVSSLQSIDDLEKYYKHIVNNVNVGAYSFIKQ